MRLKPVVILAMFILGFAPGCAVFAHAETLAGYERFTVTAPHRAGPLAGSVWYPVGRATYRSLIGDNAVFQGIPAYVGAAPADGKFPLVVLSHGSGGNMDNLAWLSSQLALHGAMVVAVNHPGSTTGDSSPRRSITLAERAADLKATLTYILADPLFGPHIDRTRIMSLGFSLGGATALNLAGARMDRGLYQNYCATFDEVDCVFFAKGGVDFKKLPPSFEGNMRDPRLTAAVAIDPGMTHAMTKQSIAAIKMPVLLINLGNKAPMKASDVSAEGSNLAAKLPRAEYVTLTPAIHFTFLALCKPEGSKILAEERDDSVCSDPKETDRAKIHDTIIAHIVRFLKL